MRRSSAGRAFGAGALALCLAAGLVQDGQAQRRGPARAQAAPTAQVPARDGPQHLVIVDHESGLVLRCDGCRTPIPPASMSKLMTVLLVAEALAAGRVTEDTMFTVSQRAWEKGAKSAGSHMFLPLGAQVRVGDLLRGAIIVSANDACIVLAEGLAGSVEAFVDQMNTRAAALGLESARFVNVTGLSADDDEIAGPSTAETLISTLDLARLASHIIAEHPDLHRLYGQREFQYGPHRPQANRNPLLGAVAGADGMKTGYTEASGYGLVGTALREGQRRIVVFNGAPSDAARRQAARTLMEAAFTAFTVRRLYGPEDVVGAAPVRLGGRRSVSLKPAAPVYAAAPRAQWGSLRAHIVFEGPLPAPIAAGAQVATLVIEGPGGERRETPLVAGERVGRADPFSRALAGAGVLLGGS